MDSTNGKRLPTQVLNERRRQAVKLRLGGMKLATVAETVGLSPGMIISAVKSCKAGGWRAVAIAARGRSVGDGRTLTADQEKAICKLISDRTPDQLKMPYALWTRSAVGDLIQQQFGVKLPAPVRLLIRVAKSSGRVIPSVIKFSATNCIVSIPRSRKNAITGL